MGCKRVSFSLACSKHSLILSISPVTSIYINVWWNSLVTEYLVIARGHPLVSFCCIVFLPSYIVFLNKLITSLSIRIELRSEWNHSKSPISAFTPYGIGVISRNLVKLSILSKNSVYERVARWLVCITVDDKHVTFVVVSTSSQRNTWSRMWQRNADARRQTRSCPAD